MHIIIKESKTSSQVHSVLDFVDLLFSGCLRGEDVPKSKRFITCSSYYCTTIGIHCQKKDTVSVTDQGSNSL